MVDDLQENLRATTGQGPSSEFVAELRSDIQAEPTRKTHAASDQPFVALVHGAGYKVRPVTRLRWIAVALTVAIALTAGAVVATNLEEDQSVNADQSPASDEGTPTKLDFVVEERRLQLLSVPFPDGGMVIEAIGDANQVSATFRFSSDQFDAILMFYEDWTSSDPRDWAALARPAVEGEEVSWNYDPGNVTVRIRLYDCSDTSNGSDAACVTIRETGDYPP